MSLHVFTSFYVSKILSLNGLAWIHSPTRSLHGLPKTLPTLRLKAFGSVVVQLQVISGGHMTKPVEKFLPSIGMIPDFADAGYQAMLYKPLKFPLRYSQAIRFGRKSLHRFLP
jgi:hypothetical protein